LENADRIFSRYHGALRALFYTAYMNEAIAADENGAKAVQVVSGVYVARHLLAAGLADELHVEIKSVFPGSGLCGCDDSARVPLGLKKI
jgi:dihydrofolate reductase